MQQVASLEPRNLLNLYLDQKYDQLSEKFIEILGHFEQVPHYVIKPDLQYFIDVFIKNFLYLFTQPDYHLSNQYAFRFIQLNPVIANLTAISHLGNTDYYLVLLQKQEKNFIKLLTLYSPRNTVKIDYKELFQTNAKLASQWYSYYVELYLSALANPIALDNLQQHINYADDEKLSDFANIADVYFGATYIDPENDRFIKQRLNTAIQNSPFCRNAAINNQPNPKKIAVITCLWHERHSVYRTLSEFIASLENDYELTLIYLGKNRPELNIKAFTKILYLESSQGVLNINPIRNNDYMMVYYPDVGMSPESILLSNLRIAPIQLCGTGHPVSTFGSKIDYFVSGVNVESPEHCQSNYTERVILLPGNGAIHNCPTYEIKQVEKSRSEIIINCSWLSQKVNYHLLQLLKQIKEKANNPVLFYFFSGSSLRKNGFVPFVRDLQAILGENSFQVFPGKPYPEYMALMEQGDLTLDPYPFGGSNIMADSLYLRKPTISYEGTKWYNRIGSQMLRQVGLSEMITNNDEDYVNLTVRLIDDSQYRQEIHERLQKVDLRETIFHSDNKQYFKKMVDFLISNHQQLETEQEREPIIIPE